MTSNSATGSTRSQSERERERVAPHIWNTHTHMRQEERRTKREEKRERERLFLCSEREKHRAHDLTSHLTYRHPFSSCPAFFSLFFLAMSLFLSSGSFPVSPQRLPLSRCACVHTTDILATSSLYEREVKRDDRSSSSSSKVEKKRGRNQFSERASCVDFTRLRISFANTNIAYTHGEKGK